MSSEAAYFEQFMGDVIWYTIMINPVVIWAHTTCLEEAIAIYLEAKLRPWYPIKENAHIIMRLNAPNGEPIGRIA